MKAVWRNVIVPDVNAQPVVGACVDDCARHALVECRLVDVGHHQLVGLGHEISGVEVFAVDKGRQPPRVHLIRRDDPFFVSHVSHAVALVDDWGRDFLVWRNRRVISNGLDFEKDVFDLHG